MAIPAIRCRCCLNGIEARLSIAVPLPSGRSNCRPLQMQRFEVLRLALMRIVGAAAEPGKGR